MAECFLVQSGGMPLNFKVVCNPQPSTAKENTIWVDTDKINNYYFSAEQPENMAEYDVWFLIGTSSTIAFNATKKNTIMVYPLSAKQYVGGAFVSKVAKIYQGGAWWVWDERTLYKSGDEYERFTGGWLDIGGYAEYSNGTMTKNSTNIVLRAPNEQNMSRLTTNKPISIDNFKTLCVKVTNQSGPTEKRMYVTQSHSAEDYPCQVDIASTGTFKLDISSLTGNGTPSLCALARRVILVTL